MYMRVVPVTLDVAVDVNLNMTDKSGGDRHSTGDDPLKQLS